MKRTALISAALLLGLFLLAVPESEAHYISELEFFGHFWYKEGWTPVGHLHADYNLTLNIPAGTWEWYVDPFVQASFQANSFLTGSLLIDDWGIAMWIDSSPLISEDWASLGVTYVPGLGIYAGEYETSDPLLTFDPNWLVGRSFGGPSWGWDLTFGSSPLLGYKYYVKASLYDSLGLPFDLEGHFCGSVTATATTTAAPIPEPGTLLLLSSGLLGLAGYGRVRFSRKKKNQA